MIMMRKMCIKGRFLLSGDYWQRSIQKIINSFLVILGIIWLGIEIVNYFFKDMVPVRAQLFWFILAVSLVVSLLFNLQKLKFDYSIKNKDIKIKLVIGDIFKQNGDIILATNTTFDTTLMNGFISNNSIQGQLATNYYLKIEHLDQELEECLERCKVSEILNRSASKNNRYPIGTTVKLIHSNFKSYWVALSDVNENGKPASDFQNLQIALESLWEFMLDNGHMERLVIPIFGSGKSAINESREKILKEIIYSFVTFSNEKKITEELVVCIYPKDFIDKNINLMEINKFLEYNCHYRYDNVNSKITSLGI